MSERLRRQALKLLAERPLSLKELAGEMSLTEKKAFNALRHLFDEGEIESFRDVDDQRRYRARSIST